MFGFGGVVEFWDEVFGYVCVGEVSNRESWVEEVLLWEFEVDGVFKEDEIKEGDLFDGSDVEE